MDSGNQKTLNVTRPYPLLLGTDHKICKKIEWACGVMDAFGPAILADAVIDGLLKGYQGAIKNTLAEMSVAGVAGQCADCAVNDNGSCCGNGIENRFDPSLLLVNLLMGCKLPMSRLDPHGCLFLGGNGCLIAARHLICINYICKRLKEKIDPKALRHLEKKIGDEADAGFALEEALKRWLRMYAL